MKWSRISISSGPRLQGLRRESVYESYLCSKHAHFSVSRVQYPLCESRDFFSEQHFANLAAFPAGVYNAGFPQCMSVVVLVLTAASSPVTLRSATLRPVVLLSLEGEIKKKNKKNLPSSESTQRGAAKWVDVVLLAAEGTSHIEDTQQPHLVENLRGSDIILAPSCGCACVCVWS